MPPPVVLFSTTPLAHTCSMVEVGGVTWPDYDRYDPAALLKEIHSREDWGSKRIAIYNSNSKLEGWDEYLVKEYDGNSGYVWSYMIPLMNEDDERLDEELEF